MRLVDHPQTSPWVWATPLVGMLLFLLAMGAFLFSLYTEDKNLTQARIQSDLDNVRNNIAVKLTSLQEKVALAARVLSEEPFNDQVFFRASQTILKDHPEATTLILMDNERSVKNLALAPNKNPHVLHPLHETIEDADNYWAFLAARETRLPVFSRPFLGDDSKVYIEIHGPLISEGQFKGTLAVSIPLSNLLAQSLPEEFIKFYQFSIVDGGGNPIASNVSRTIEHAKLSHEIPLDPPGHGLRLRTVLFKTSNELFSNMLAWTVLGLSLVIVWGFGLLYRHAKMRSQAEHRLRAETEFRQAMENSVITGMRAIDMRGRITYVNPAFCKMTGYTEQELVGILPPFPYWPENSVEQRKFLDIILAGAAPERGFEIQVKRRDGRMFDARMYVSPLIDNNSKQTGWMTSMTDITEPRRIREELAAAHRRFVRILEELDAAVSIRTPESQEDEFIFINHLHREWFANAAPPKFNRGRRKLQHTSPIEWLNPNSQRWYEIRRRSISWVDGATVIMQVATDITLRKNAEDLNRQQQEKLQFTSRLITLGELASSLAHEINQPLAAVRNYISGCINRLKSGRVQTDELLPILDKINIQTQRAGDVIRRIREFVKQQEPKRVPCVIGKIIEDAVGFSQLQANRTQSRIELNITESNAMVLADSVLIEQVLMNLIKNGLEAMHHLDPNERVIEITTQLNNNLVKTSVRDNGIGVPEHIRERLFESFFTTKSEGMGMGLNICRTIIEYHQGQLWVEPAPNQGSIFQFTLPLAKTTDL